jgi:23S rRNA (pseudouridine1915-N3)-methyltransferase
MKYEILLLGKTKSSFITEGINDYYKRLQHYSDFHLREIKVKKLRGSDEQIMDKEAEILLANVSSATFLVALDSHGKQYSSTEFSTIIDRWENSSTRHVTFVIGGPLGLGESVLRRAQLTVSLSRMTFTHDMARLFLLEQLYRAYTIKAGEKYHK